MVCIWRQPLCVSLRQWNAMAAIDISKKKTKSKPLVDAMIKFFQYPVVNYTMSANETLGCHTEIEVNRLYFGFAQKSLHDFQKAVYELIVTNATKTIP